MGKLATGTMVAAGAIGTLLIAAAQTKPEDAQGNIAGWLRSLGFDQLPGRLLPATWATLVGAVFVGITIAFLLWHRLRVAPADEGGGAYMPLHRAVRWLVQHSIWAAAYPPALDDQWVQQADTEFQSTLSTGRLKAWGIFKPHLQDAEAALSEIPADFWRHAQWNSHHMVTGEPPTHIWRDSAHGGGAYRRVVLLSDDVRTVWPRRSRLAAVLRRSPTERIDRTGYGDIWRRQDAYYDKLRRRPAYGAFDALFESPTPSQIDQGD